MDFCCDCGTRLTDATFRLDAGLSKDEDEQTLARCPVCHFIAYCNSRHERLGLMGGERVISYWTRFLRGAGVTLNVLDLFGRKDPPQCTYVDQEGRICASQASVRCYQCHLLLCCADSRMHTHALNEGPIQHTYCPDCYVIVEDVIILHALGGEKL